MPRIILLVIAGIFICQPSIAQKSERSNSKRSDRAIIIRGKVVDGSTQEPIIGATILVMGLDSLNGTVSRVDGSFVLEGVPSGRNRIEIRHVGYEPVQLENVRRTSGAFDLVIEVDEIVQQMGEVVVTDSRYGEKVPVEEYQVSARSLDFQETKNYPASIGDPTRMVTLLPGVSLNGDDLSNDISIRGNASKGILWRLEGIEIPSPNHFSGVGRATGSLSVFSSQVVGNAEFLTGAFPSDVGNALAGVFDMSFRTGNPTKRSYILQAGVLGLDVASEGPLIRADSSSYLFNYRYSTLSLADRLGLQLDEDANNNFQDLSFNLHFPTKKWGNWSLFGVGGLSNFFARPSERKEQRETYNVGILGLKHHYAFSPKWRWVNTFSVSANYAEVRDDEEVGNANQFSDGEYRRSFLRWKSDVVTRLSPNKRLQFGTIISLLGFDYQQLEGFEFEELERLEELDLFDEPVVAIDEQGNSSTVQAYINYSERLNARLTFNAGLHALYFELNEEFILEPRANVKWQIDNQQLVGLAYGRHSRMESLEFYFGRDQLNDSVSVQNNQDLDLSKADHWVLSYDLSWGGEYHLRAELYHQRLFAVPVVANSFANTQFGVYSALLGTDQFKERVIFADLANEGTGANTGVEILIERRGRNGLYVMGNTSFYKATYRGGDGISRRSRFDGLFGFNALWGKQWTIGRGGDGVFGLSSRMIWQGSNRYIPIIIPEFGEEDTQVFDYSRAFENRLPDYFRLDLQLSYLWTTRKLTHECRFDIQNLTPRKCLGAGV